MGRRLRVWMAIALLAVSGASLLLLPTQNARACGFSLPAPNARALYLAMAERALDDDDALLATRSLGFVTLGSSAAAGDDPLIELRRTTIASKLAVRAATNHQLAATSASTGRHAGAVTPPPTPQELKAATKALRAVAQTRQRSPRSLTDLAEALALDPAGHAEAKTILEDLARRDLITSAFGWAALARLRAAQGDVVATRAALSRCAQMTRTADVCQAKTGAEPVPHTPPPGQLGRPAAS